MERKHPNSVRRNVLTEEMKLLSSALEMSNRSGQNLQYGRFPITVSLGRWLQDNSVFPAYE